MIGFFATSKTSINLMKYLLFWGPEMSIENAYIQAKINRFRAKRPEMTYISPIPAYIYNDEF